MSLPRETAIDRVEEVLETVERNPMPVPVREVWVYGEVALGLDPIERLDVYLTKDLLMRDDPDREDEFVESHGVRGVGTTVRAEWAEAHPEYLRANANGHAAPEKCLAAHLLDEGEPIHLEVCNSSFDDNVTQRLRGAEATDDFTRLLDPRGVCLWIDGIRSDEAFRKLRESEFAFPTLSQALQSIGLEPERADAAAEEFRDWHERQDGTTVRGDVV
jgi:hypothetical protein